MLSPTTNCDIDGSIGSILFLKKYALKRKIIEYNDRINFVTEMNLM